MIQNLLRSFACAGIGVGAMVMGASAQQPAQPVPSQPQPAQPAPAQSNQPQAVDLSQLPMPITSLEQLQDVAKMAFMLADSNNDGRISQQEATDVGYLLVGGVFFAADLDGDGVVTQEEARQVRDRILQRQPILRVFVAQARRQADTDQAAATQQQIATLLDLDNPNELKASELRGIVDGAVEGLFAVADTNRDGHLTPDEINAATIAVADAAGAAVFQLVDTNNDGQVSKEEFQTALLEPANFLFDTVDADNDGQISQAEAESARQLIMNQLIPTIPSGGIGQIPQINLPQQNAPATQPAQPAPGNIPQP